MEVLYMMLLRFNTVRYLFMSDVCCVLGFNSHFFVRNLGFYLTGFPAFLCLFCIGLLLGISCGKIGCMMEVTVGCHMILLISVLLYL